MSYEDAVLLLFQASHEAFVAERKRLSAELKAAGDKAGAARLGRLNRPPVSAWAVNQLWWSAQGAFEQLFATAARQRAGDRAAAGTHRQQLAELRTRAAELLQAAGHSAAESTLRRVTMTLAALAAAGSFEPDPPGALTGDRDPPGFESAALVGGFASEAEAEPGDGKVPNAAAAKGAVRAERQREASGSTSDAGEKRLDEAKREEAKRHEAAKREEAEQREAAKREEAKQRAEAEQERRRVEAERARRKVERQRLQAELHRAEAELETKERAAALRREELAVAESALERARTAAEQAAARLEAFEGEE